MQQLTEDCLWILLTLRFSYCITMLAAAVLYIILYRENKRRDGLDLNQQERDRLAFQDLTDKENLHFRYVL
jgi:hypothetical protein